jgi:hypothetical protein
MYWWHVVSLDDQRLVKKVYIVTKLTGKNTCWAKIVKGIFAKYGMVHVWEREIPSQLGWAWKRRK